MLQWSSLRLALTASARAALVTRLAEPHCTLDAVSDVLSEHYADRDVAVVAMSRVTALDNSEIDSRTIAQGSGLDSVMKAFRTHKKDVDVRQHCCRAIANICMLSSGADVGAIATTDEGQSSSSVSYADLLVTHNAVELVLGLLSEPLHMLSVKGRQWAAMALLNLLMFSRDGAQRAAAADGESTVAAFMESLADLDTSVGSAAAADAALAALARVVALEAPDNSKGITFRYQVVSMGLLDAVVRSVHRFGVLHGKPTTSSSELAGAQMDKLPVLHKGLEILHLAASHTGNHVMLFDALGEDAGRLRTLIQSTVSLCPVEQVRYGGASGAEAPADDMDVYLCGLCCKVHDAFVSMMTDLTAARRDVHTPGKSTESGDALGEVDSAAASSVVPTESALSFVDTASDGVLSAWSISLLAKSLRLLQAKKAEHEADTGELLWLGRLAQKHLALLTNLAESDPAVSSATVVAIIASLLERYASLLQDVSCIGGNTSNSSVCHALTPAVGQAFSCMWNIINTNAGREATKLYPVSVHVRCIVDAAEEKHEKDGSASTSQRSDTAADDETQRQQSSSIMRGLSSLGTKLLEKLEAAVESPRYVHSNPSATATGGSC